jgi:formylglycine-generating enzyme required for sulfatase activity
MGGAPPDAAGSETPADAAGPSPVNGAADGSADGLPAGAYENSLGMRLVPVPSTNVLFSIWETRVKDYLAFAQATGSAAPRPDFPEMDLSPKASVSRAQAAAFATWLTQKEQKEQKIRPTQKYRLPTDQEWDAAIAVGQTGGQYPWGDVFPPPDHFANYEISNDGFTYTSPVGSFPPNKYGLFDLAGNLWEWIGEGCQAGGAYLVRGAGWNGKTDRFLASTFHYCFPGDLVGHHNVGFRVVLEM